MEIGGGERPVCTFPTKPEPQCKQVPGSYACDKCGKEYGCLTFERFEALLRFANSTGMQLVFGLNGCHGRPSRNEPMDFSNAYALLNRTTRSAFKGSLYGLELGNELIKSYVSPTVMAADFKTLRGIVSSLWAGETSVPLIAGADEVRYMEPFLDAAQGTIDAATFHLYGQCAHDQTAAGIPKYPPVSAPGFALQPLCLVGGAEDAVGPAQKIVQKATNGGAKSWIGESALTGGGGVDGTTNAFVSSMWYADWLGFAARSNVTSVLRETLAGGFYGIVNHSSYQPNPDAFMMALFARLMGRGVLDASVVVQHSPSTNKNTAKMLRGYAHCSKRSGGATSVLLINLGSSTSFSVTLPTHSSRWEWHLRGLEGDIHSKVATLNNEPLTLEPDSTEMPRMEGRMAAPNSRLQVAPASVVFLKLDTARLCP